MDIKGFEPLTFSMQSRRSTTDLNARMIALLKVIIHTVSNAKIMITNCPCPLQHGFEIIS